MSLVAAPVVFVPLVVNVCEVVTVGAKPVWFVMLLCRMRNSAESRSWETVLCPEFYFIFPISRWESVTWL